MTNPATRPPTGFCRLSGLSAPLGPVWSVVTACHSGRSGESFLRGGDDDALGGGEMDGACVGESLVAVPGFRLFGSFVGAGRDGAALGGGDGRFFVACVLGRVSTDAGAECLGGAAGEVRLGTKTSTGWFPRSICARCLFARASACRLRNSRRASSRSAARRFSASSLSRARASSARLRRAMRASSSSRSLRRRSSSACSRRRRLISSASRRALAASAAADCARDGKLGCCSFRGWAREGNGTGS